MSEEQFHRQMIEDAIRKVGPRMAQAMLRELDYGELADSVPQIAKEMEDAAAPTPDAEA